MRGRTRSAGSHGETILLGVLSGVVVLGAFALLIHPPSALKSVANPAIIQPVELDPREGGVDGRNVTRDMSSGGVPVLCHHYLRGKTTPVGFLKILGALFFNLPLLDDMDPWTQSVAAFDAEMAYLKEAGYETVDLADVVEWQRGLRELPPKPVVITFDDGDRSVVDYAYPILQKHGFKATLFVVTSEVGRKWDRVDCLGWDDLRRLRESGVFSIQSHSHDLHRKVRTSEGTLPAFVAAQYGLYRFPSAPSWQKGVYDDLRTSRLLIEQHVGGEVNSLAWPYGFGEVALDSVAASAGFTTLCTLGAGRNRRLPWASWVDGVGETIEASQGVAPVSAAPVQHDGFTTGKVSPGRRVLWERMEIRRYAVTARTSLDTFAKLVAE